MGLCEPAHLFVCAFCFEGWCCLPCVLLVASSVATRQDPAQCRGKREKNVEIDMETENMVWDLQPLIQIDVLYTFEDPGPRSTTTKTIQTVVVEAENPIHYLGTWTLRVWNLAVLVFGREEEAHQADSLHASAETRQKQALATEEPTAPSQIVQCNYLDKILQSPCFPRCLCI